MREPAKVPPQAAASPIGGLSHQPAKVAHDEEADATSRRRNVNRHTIQPEYVQPQSHTMRGDPATAVVTPPATVAPAATTTTAAVAPATGLPSSVSAPLAARNRSDSYGGVSGGKVHRSTSRTKPPLPPEAPAVSAEATKVADYPTAASLDQQPKKQAPIRPTREIPRSVSDSTSAFNTVPSQAQTRPQPTSSEVGRPGTANTTTSAYGRPDPRLPSRGSYGQPVAPTVEAANAQGRVSRPKNGRAYNISDPIPQHSPRQSISRVPVPIRNAEPLPPPPPPPAPPRGPAAQSQPPEVPPKPPQHHRRSSTLSGLGEKLFGRSASVKGSKPNGDGIRAKRDKKYPPTSMKESYTSAFPSRTSIDSKRSFSFGLGKKKSADLESQQQMEEKPKRFSALIPSSFSFRGLGLGGGGDDRDQDGGSDSPVPHARDFPQPPSGSRGSRRFSTQQPPQYSTVGPAAQSDFSRPSPRYNRHSMIGQGNGQGNGQDPRQVDQARADQGRTDFPPPAPPKFSPSQSRYHQPPQQQDYDQQQPQHPQPKRPQQQHSRNSQVLGNNYAGYSGGGIGEYFDPTSASSPGQQPQHSSQRQSPPLPSSAQYGSSINQTQPLYPEGFNSRDGSGMQPNYPGRGGLFHKHNQRNFQHAYDYEQGPGRHEGSSGPARKVMDYFRRRKVRADGYQ